MKGDCNICVNRKLPSDSATCVDCGLSRKNYKPLTNADRIRAMTDEELAEWLETIRMYCANDLCGMGCPFEEICYSKADAPTEMLAWLKEEASE